jgi:hypothetical protein
MNFFGNLAERRYCTSVSWASRENLQARMKVQGHSSIARAKKAIQAFDTSQRQVHSIASDGCGPPKNWEKNFRPPRPESENKAYDPRKDCIQARGGHSCRGRGRGQFQDIPLYCMFHERDIDHWTRDCPIFLESKKKMTQKHNQPSTTAIVKEVSHTSHWQQPSQSSSSTQPSYQHFNLHPEYQSNYHKHPSQYYQPYNYTPQISQVHTS